MRVALCQLDCVWEDKAANLARVRALLDAPPPPGSLLVLPEMFATGFSMNTTATAEPPETGETEQFLRALAAETQCAVLAGVVTQAPGQPPRNQAVAWAPDGRELARYTKQRPFSLAGEGAHYPGGGATVVFEWGGFRIAPFVCYDLRFPELFRAAVQQGADLLTVIASWPARRLTHWLTLLQARAIENQACVIGVNRCGRDSHFSYAGRSVAIDPQGCIRADAGSEEGVTLAEFDPAWAARWREEFPALRDAGWPGAR